MVYCIGLTNVLIVGELVMLFSFIWWVNSKFEEILKEIKEIKNTKK